MNVNNEKSEVDQKSWNSKYIKGVFITHIVHELGYELFFHPPYDSDLAPRDYFLCSNIKRMLAVNKFSSNEEMIAEAEG